MAYRFKTTYKQLLADTTTPVSTYLRLRDVFPNSLLLESSEYHSRENNMSYICCQPIAGITLDRDFLEIRYPGSAPERKPASGIDLREEVSRFRAAFSENEESEFRFISNGLFGFFTFDAVTHFEDIELQSPADPSRDIPYLQYHVYRYVIAIDHFRNQLYIFEHRLENDESPSGLEKVQYLIQNKNFPEYTFSTNGEETSNMTDDAFRTLVGQMKTHIYRGDVFQIVPSRSFSRPFLGDEFNVYRSLRSINPSPYLFYFDYGDFKLFGSSPEAQLTIRDREATIYPIAGTFKRSGNMEQDEKIAEALKEDPKESAEHVMLVDLARNDLSRHCEQVHVKSYKEAQYYSHIIHLVSKVCGTLKSGVNSFDVVGDTFPAGTLSGAPKHMAMQLIDRYENQQRSFYSGAIGYMGFNGDFNHAIMIRSFLSKNNTLHYQAGAGIVADSDPENELQEVNNKIAALRKALELAQDI
ncbi:anthranilate synthase component I family protein [Parapedobacter sp. DT-150]|uniref:anthranilate synthase component I family protein n=1 Tax=Parapedobacter sp. DT-150 TaxID=3396162 RepID=UPI003F1B5256